MAHGHGGHGHHHHHHHHGHDHSANAERNLGWAFFLNLFFALIELIGGLWAGSLAILSDALHDLGDAMSLGLGYFLQRKSRAKPNSTYSYGLKRLSLLSAVISGLIISLGAITILRESIPRLMEPTEPNGMAMLGLAVLGLTVNGFAAWKMSGGQTHNEKMLTWHLIEDVLGWSAVLVGSVLMIFFQWNWLDPLLAIAISIFVLYNVIRQLYQTTNLFLQANPDPDGLKDFRAKVEKLKGVKSLHDVHFWSLDGVHHVLSMHVVSDASESSASIKSQIRHLSEALGSCHVTIEFESSTEACETDCESPA